MPSGASLPWCRAQRLNAWHYGADLSADGQPPLARIWRAR